MNTSWLQHRTLTLLPSIASRFGASVLAASLLTGAVDAFAGTHTWSGAINDQWNIAGNWSSGGVPTTNEVAPVILVFPGSTETRSATRNTIPGLTVDRLTIQRAGYRFSALGSTLRFRGGGDKIWTAGSVVPGTNTFESSFSMFLLDDAEIEVGSGQTVAIHGRISGPGGLRKTGNGALELVGSQGNTYLGTTILESGLLRLGKTGGALAIPGELHIGVGSIANEDVVRLLVSNQLNSARKVVVGPSGWLDLNGRNATVGGLELVGGRVSSGAGELRLAGDVTALASDRAALIQGKLSLGGGHRRFTTALGTAPESDLHVQAVVSGTGLYSGLRKAGAGRLELSGNNTYAGPTTVEAGWLTVSSASALGIANSTSLIPSGTTVRDGATLSLVGVGLGDEDLGLAGHGVNGAGALVAQSALNLGCRIGLLSSATIRVGNLPSSTVTLTRFVHGTGALIKTGPGTLRFVGNEPNTHTGGTEIREGSLVLAKTAGVVSLAGSVVVGDALGSEPDELWVETTGQLSPNAVIHLASSGRWTIPSGRDEVIAGIEGQGRLTIEGRLLVNMPEGERTFEGFTTGTGELRKNGNGTLVLGGQLQHGVTRLTAGTIRFEAPTTEGRVVVDGGTLEGQGPTGRVEGKGGVLAPGMGPEGTGVFLSGNLRFFPTATLRFNVNGLTGNTQYDQWATIGTVDLGGARLDLSFGFAPPAGSKFVLFMNDGTDPITGRFLGLSEGAQFQSAGIPLRITYVGGSGANDVVLEVLGEPANARRSMSMNPRDGTFRVQKVTLPNRVFRVERSEDLAHWEVVGAVLSGEDGRLEFVDRHAPAVSGFYRMIEEQESER